MPQLWSWKVCVFLVGVAVVIDVLVVQSPLVWLAGAGMLAIGAQFWNPISSLAVVIFTCGLLSYSPFESGALSRLYPGDLAIGIFLVAWLVGRTSWSVDPLCSLLLPLLYSGVLFGRHSLSRYRSVCVLFVLCLVGLVLTFSRESWLLAFLGLVFVSALWLRRHVTSVLPLIIIAVLLFTVLVSGAVGLVSRFYNPDEVYGLERIYFYVTALQLFATHPLLGVGAGNYQFFDRTYAEVSAGGVAHNQFLSVAAETGVHGLLMFLWLVVALLRFLLKFKVG